MIKIQRRNSIGFKFIAGLSLFAVILSLAASTIGYLEFRNNYENQYREQAYIIGKMISSNIDGNNIDRYFTESAFTTISILQSSLNSFWESMEINYIYLAKSDGEVQYIFREDIAPSEINKNELSIFRELHDTDYYVSKESKDAMGVSIPILNNQGDVVAFVKTQISLVQMEKGILRYVIESMVLNLTLAALITMVYTSYIRKNVIYPITGLSKGALEFANSHYKEQPNIQFTNTKDEIDNLSRTISKMTNDITEYVENIEHNVVEKEKLNAELRVAKEIQESLLPKDFPETEQLDLFAMMTSANEVGGDFYDYFFLEENKVSMVLGDVSGKGIPAALFMASTKEIIKNRSTDGNPPYRVFEIANNKLSESSNNKMFVTSWHGVLDLDNGKLTYVSAGHPQPMIKRGDKGFEPLSQRNNRMLVAFEDTKYRQSTTELNPGDIVFVYTDGVIEARNKEDEFFGEERLIESLDKISEIAPDLKSMVVELRKEIMTYEKDSSQKDDCTMLAFRYKGNTPSDINHLM